MGSCILGFARKLGNCSVTDAKLWGVYDGLLQAWQLGVTWVVLELDNWEVVQLVKAGPGAAVHNALVSEIQRSLQQEWTVKVSHVYLEGNSVAGALAATAFRLPLGLVLLQQPPDEVA
ncbi:hypothetical protein PVK06_024097 [Gossypium arboreum]|uniref:RNase H type-1 domain-containing protein n=1 Tax=Gossypium arboreum TaxID=29729 RepID=A0ABR0PD03_GOSAR|nr:hypothetical protein PVK06_024097 [Gossypium arboreum]